MKPFLTYEQQLDKLEGRGLAIGDRAAAERALRDISYFALVNGYKRPFQDSDTGRYREGTSFADIVSLYDFDDDLRELVQRALAYVERRLRSCVSYAFCERHGEVQAAYLDAGSYTPSRRRAYDVNRLLKLLDGLANSNTDYAYIVHQRRSHGNVPLWVLAHAMTFGQASRMYSVMLPGDRAAVSKQFPRLNERELEQSLKVLVLFRNVCAHGERLYSYRARYDVPDLPLHAKLGIPVRGSQYLMGKRDLFAVVLALRYLMPSDRFLSFKRDLARLVERYVSKGGSVRREELLGAMGFPENWKSLTRYGL